MDKISIRELDGNQDYSALLTPMSLESPFGLIQHLLQEGTIQVNGKILVDSVLTVGNNEDRFIEMIIDEGKIEVHTLSTITLSRQDCLRKLANEILREQPTVVDNSILNSLQKKMLLKGISI